MTSKFKVGASFAAIIVCASFALGPAHAGPSLLFEPLTGKVVSQDRAGVSWYPASLTKLMTAYLTFQALREGRVKLEQHIPVSSIAALQPPSKIGIRAGGSVSVDFALQALLIHSANDIAVALAEAVGGNLPTFVLEMNRAAQRIGMTGTRFMNPHGLHDANHFSTARDIGLLAAAVYGAFPEYRHYFSQAEMAVGNRKLRNRNGLLRQMPEADGMKTGFVCAAGFNLVASADIHGKRMIAVVFGASNGKSRADWAQELLTSGTQMPSSSTTVKDIANALRGESEPPNLSAQVCGERRGVTVRPAQSLKGYGTSLGRFDTREEASRVLRVWSDSGDAHMEGAEKGLVRLSRSGGYSAMVWDLDQEGAQSLCDFLKDRKATCQIMGPDILKQFAAQARLEKKPKPKLKNQTTAKKK